MTQPPYSQDLVPCDFWLFPKLKSPLKGKRFQTINEIHQIWWAADGDSNDGFCSVLNSGRDTAGTVWGPKMSTLKGTEKSLSWLDTCNMKNRDIYWRRYKIPETLCVGLHTVLPNAISCCVVVFWVSSWSEISSFTEVILVFIHCSLPLYQLSCRRPCLILVFRRARSHRAPNVGCKRGWITWVICCFAKKLYVRRFASIGVLSWQSCQSPVAHSCSLLSHLNSFCGGMSKPNTKCDADCLLYSVILNVMATQYTCSLSGIYHPHWLVAWSHHCSCIRIPVPSPWLSGYTDVVQTILVILTMAGFFSGQTSYNYFFKTG